MNTQAPDFTRQLLCCCTCQLTQPHPPPHPPHCGRFRIRAPFPAARDATFVGFRARKHSPDNTCLGTALVQRTRKSTKNAEAVPKEMWEQPQHEHPGTRLYAPTLVLLHVPAHPTAPTTPSPALRQIPNPGFVSRRAKRCICMFPRPEAQPGQQVFGDRTRSAPAQKHEKRGSGAEGDVGATPA
jgi:hypothetical protein